MFSHFTASTAEKRRKTYQFSAKHSQFMDRGDDFPISRPTIYLATSLFRFISLHHFNPIKRQTVKTFRCTSAGFPPIFLLSSHTTTRHRSQKGATENVEGTLHIFFCCITEDCSSRFEGDILPIFRKIKKSLYF